MQIRAIIVDDEWLARKRLEILLESYQEIRIVGYGRNGKEALELIQLKEPELVFLDIQMPDMDGFGLLQQLAVDRMPAIIFTTAFDQYAIKAFEIEAVDYLLKPFDEDRLQAALDRVLKRLEFNKMSQFQTQLLQLVETHQQQLNQEERLYFEIKQSGKIIRVPVEDIYFVKSEGNYVALHTQKKKYLYRLTMNAIAQELNPALFLRIHRSYLINTRYIAKQRYLQNNEFEFQLKNGQQLLSSKSYKEKIQAFLAKQ
ncbi:MAG: LytTR family DNA-binding domain-containing protein [Saprospiraceae bacterium]|nr:LytTR family DNA-binding domain-containing protein [Saprospiraceae bacterium]